MPHCKVVMSIRNGKKELRVLGGVCCAAVSQAQQVDAYASSDPVYQRRQAGWRPGSARLARLIAAISQWTS